MFPVGALLSLSSIISPLSLFDVVVIALRISRLRSKIPLSLSGDGDGVILIFLLPGRDPSWGEVRGASEEESDAAASCWIPFTELQMGQIQYSGAQ